MYVCSLGRNIFVSESGTPTYEIAKIIKSCIACCCRSESSDSYIVSPLPRHHSNPRLNSNSQRAKQKVSKYCLALTHTTDIKDVALIVPIVIAVVEVDIPRIVRVTRIGSSTPIGVRGSIYKCTIDYWWRTLASIDDTS